MSLPGAQEVRPPSTSPPALRARELGQHFPASSTPVREGQAPGEVTIGLRNSVRTALRLLPSPPRASPATALCNMSPEPQLSEDEEPREVWQQPRTPAAAPPSHLPQTHTPAATLPRHLGAQAWPHHSASEPASTSRRQPRLQTTPVMASGARPGGLSSANPETN